tara:strand:- start:20 stop:139 length:120 start_codon:yes stop_codon:yes gene_type:complete
MGKITDYRCRIKKGEKRKSEQNVRIFNKVIQKPVKKMRA